MPRIPSGRGWRIGALLVGVATAAGLIAGGTTPWVATVAGMTPVLLAVACAVPCLLRLVLLRRSGGCDTTRGQIATVPGGCEAAT
jgi:hypothetical protein